jgi:hypothetical protein
MIKSTTTIRIDAELHKKVQMSGLNLSGFVEHALRRKFENDLIISPSEKERLKEYEDASKRRAEEIEKNLKFLEDTEKIVSDIDDLVIQQKIDMNDFIKSEVPDFVDPTSKYYDFWFDKLKKLRDLGLRIGIKQLEDYWKVKNGKLELDKKAGEKGV